ncbi:MAG: hypothetical protein ACRCTD_04040 [Beijerinckiaceae bacterium]
MIDPFWLALATKILIASAVVVSASLIAQRSSPFIGAMVATLPISAGPIIVFLAYEYGAAYVARSSIGSIAALAANGLFLTGYIFAAQRFGYVISLVTGLAGWFAFILLFDVNSWTVPTALLALSLVFAAGIPLTQRFRHVAMPAVRPRIWYDVPLRVLGVAAITGLSGYLGQRVGPTISGFVAVFPVVFTSLTLILHHTVGGKVTAAVLANSFWGLAGFAVALAFVHYSIEKTGWPLGLALGLGICIVWNMGLVVIRQRRVRQSMV